MADEGLDIPVTMPGADPARTALLRIADAVEKVGKKTEEVVPKTETLGEKFKKIGDAARYYNDVRGAITSTLGALIDFGREVNEQAIAGDRTRIALESLGGAYELVQQSTRGTVTAAEAYRTQQTLAQAGIRTTDTSLAAITRTARDHARALGVETPRALEQLTDALREGEQGGLRRFGIAVQSGATNVQTFESAIHQMEAAQRSAAPATLTMAESSEQLGASVTRVTNGLALWISQGAGLDGFLARASRGVRGLADDLELLNSRAVTPEGRAEAAGRAEALSEYTRQRAALRAALEASGGDTSALPDSRDVGELTTAQLRGRASRMRELTSPGDTGGGVLVGGVDLLARDRPTMSPAELSEQARRLRAELDSERAEAERAATPRAVYGDAEATAQAARDKGALNATLQARRAAASSAESAARARDVAEMADQVREKQRLNAELLRELSLSEQLAANDRGKREAAGAMDRAERERIEAREASAGVGAKAAQNEAYERRNSTRIRSFFAEQANAAVDLRKTVEDAYGAMTGAAGAHFEALVTGQETAGAALQGFVHDTLSAWAKIAAQRAMVELGAGFASLFTNPAAAPAHFTAAALYGVAAAATGGLAAATAPAAASGSARASSGGESQRAADVSPRRSDGGGGGGMTIVQNYYAPTFGGREGTEAEIGVRLDRFDDAARARLQRRAA
jgi:hypothetical protein